MMPPPDLNYCEWAAQYFVLADVSSSQPGKFRPWPYQREPLFEMGNPLMPRVTWQKSARIGYTKCLVAALAARAATAPCAMILLVPTDDDARGYAVDEIEPAFDQTPELRGLISEDRSEGRNTLTRKTIAGGGSLKILAAKSPRNLRRHDAKMLFVDEEDGMVVTPEGDAVMLAERRTFAHPDRKIIRGSTPTTELLSSIARAYGESDQRVFEIPCPHCHRFFELTWQLIKWPKDQPDGAYALCPHCDAAIDERFKSQMVNEGGERGWLITRPDIKGHAGFRSNTLVSLFTNARWPLLAAEFLKARRAGASELQVFANTIEGRVWKTSLDDIDDHTLRKWVEDFGIMPDQETGKSRIPVDCLLILAAVDTQDDRFEIGYFGFSQTEMYFLDHQVIWGDPAEPATTEALDAMLMHPTFEHPNGWMMKIEGAAVDSQGHRTQAVYNFCWPRMAKRIYPIKGIAGSRRIWTAAEKGKLMLVGHDEAKTTVLNRLAVPPTDKDGKPLPGRLHLSVDLPDTTFEQLTAEKRVVRYIRSVPVIEFVRRRPGMPNEALDLACYAWALRQSMRVNWLERKTRKGGPRDPVKPAGRQVISSPYMQR